ncbi:MAG TPA: hypothetical protein VM261_00090 [Kofleriaceae bacterium]|nr:hypothetical protein [Kofleriaceae bacterium]
MSDSLPPLHRDARQLLALVADDVATTAWGLRASAEATCEAIERAIDALDLHGDAPPIDALTALRLEVRAQVRRVRATEPGAVNRLERLLHLLIEAEHRHLQRQQR